MLKCQLFAQTAIDSSLVYTVVDKQAEPIGGMIKVFQYLSKQNLANSNIDSQTLNSCYKLIQFIVEKDGSLTYIDNDKCLDKGFEKKLKKTINNSPKWNPAILNGQTVRQKNAISFSCISVVE
jgi:periplasmic protein TonB